MVGKDSKPRYLGANGNNLLHGDGVWKNKLQLSVAFHQTSNNQKVLFSIYIQIR